MQDSTLQTLREVVKALSEVTNQVVRDGRAALAADDHVEIIRHFAQLRDVNLIIKDGRTLLSEIEDEFSKDHIPGVVTRLKEKTGQKPPFNIEGIGRVSVAYRFSCSILGDKTEGHNWLKEHDAASLVTETVNAGTLAAYAKDIVVNQGGSLPDDIFKVSSSPYTSITKS